MNTDYIIDLEEEMEEYLDTISLAMSKGTANVSSMDKKKLRPLLRHYAKMKHPFTTCVRDNRKRFGAHTEEYCAVLKDLIVGNTKWRGKGKKYVPKNLSEEQADEFLTEIGVENISEGFVEYVNNLSESDIELMTNTDIIAEKANLAAGDLVWQPSSGFSYLRRELEEVLRDEYANIQGYSDYWVEDINGSEALVCYKGSDYYVIPFSKKKGEIVLGEEETWKPVEKAWVETNLSQDPQVLAELYLEDSQKASEEDGLIWKTIIREGKWKFSPGPGQVPINKPITVIKAGKSDAKKFVISMEELKKNFEQQIVEHVTIPPTHEDKVLENTGFIKALRIGKDEKGRAILEAAHDFTEPEVKEKVKRGSIANTSAGVLFDYIQKETGKKFNAVLAHVSLTNHPWLNGMKPFGVETSEDLTVVAFSEEDNIISNSAEKAEGGEIVSTTEEEQKNENKETPIVSAPSFLEELGLSEDEVKERLARLDSTEAEVKKINIENKVKAWQEEGKSPALVKEAKNILMSDKGVVSINLSEDGETKTLSLSEVVERLVAVAPTQKLNEDQTTEEEAAGDKPNNDTQEENEKANFTQEEKVVFFSAVFDDKLTEEQAFDRVKKLRAKSD